MSDQTPRVSIGMAVYNGENYLRETLDSILAQTFTDFELIISDNASTDNTQQICQQYAARDKRIKYFRNVRNLGVAPNLNRVVNLARGEYFKWADHDDTLAPELIARCVEVLDTHPEVAICYPRVYLIDANSNQSGTYDPLPKTDSAHPHIRFGNLIVEPDGRAIQTMALMRRNLLLQTGLNGSYPSSDEVVMARIALLGSFYELPERLLSYRIHPKQSTKGVLASERARVLFIDSSLKGKAVLIKWPYLKDCLDGIHQAPLSFVQRVMCYGQLLRWLLLRKNFRSISKDLLLAIHMRVPLFPRLYREVQETANQVEV